MNIDLLQALVSCETDLNGALRRFSGNEMLYVACLFDFLSDTTMAELTDALDRREWDDAFTAAHALKGLAGNMGFIPLFHATGELVVTIRTGRIAEIGSSSRHVKSCYQDITSAIRSNCGSLMIG